MRLAWKLQTTKKMIRCDESICYKLKISQMDFSFFFLSDLSVSHPREDELTIREIPSVEDIFVVYKLILKNSLLANVKFPGENHDFGNF